MLLFLKLTPPGCESATALQVPGVGVQGGVVFSSPGKNSWMCNLIFRGSLPRAPHPEHESTNTCLAQPAYSVKFPKESNVIPSRRKAAELLTSKGPAPPLKPQSTRNFTHNPLGAWALGLCCHPGVTDRLPIGRLDAVWEIPWQFLRMCGNLGNQLLLQLR